MDPERRVELRIPSIPGFEKLAMSAVAELAIMSGLPQDRAEELRTAVSEACLNAIKHGNQQDAAAIVEVEFVATETELRIDVRDDGRGGPVPESVFATPDMAAQMSGEQPAGGLGLFVIRSFVDSAKFTTPSTGVGNQFRMILYLGGTE